MEFDLKLVFGSGQCLDLEIYVAVWSLFMWVGLFSSSLLGRRVRHLLGSAALIIWSNEILTGSVAGCFAWLVCIALCGLKFPQKGQCRGVFVRQRSRARMSQGALENLKHLG